MTTQQRFQMARVEAFRCANAKDLILEADRSPSHASHILTPIKPLWLFGSPQAVLLAVDSLMASLQEVCQKDGRILLRKQRADYRGVLGCITSYPIETKEFRRGTAQDQKLFRDWAADTDMFMQREFGELYIAAVPHYDEGYPHFHHYIVGPAAHIHPGLRAELEDGRRIADAKERLRRYRMGMRQFLDRFHAQVGIKYGHARNGNIRPNPRIPDRKSYFVLKEVERILRENGIFNAESLAHEIFYRPRPT
jgi:hypothetical protein